MLIAASTIVPPSLILLLCIVAGVGTLMLLPSRLGASRRRLGGVMLALGLIALMASAVHAILPQGPQALGAYFWIFSLIAIVGAIRVVTHPRPVYSALYFVLTVFASAGLFILLSADFMAAALVLIYAGAILITYVFVIMLAAQATNVEGSSPLAGLASYDVTSREPFVACCAGFATMGTLLFLIFDKASGLGAMNGIVESAGGAVIPAEAITGPTQALGVYLFRHQVVNLELAGLVLTLSMIGAIVIARRQIMDPSQPIGAIIEEVLGPATPVNDDPHSIPVIGTRNASQKAYPEH